MARPVIGVPSVFAADLNFTTGPALLIGTATKISRSAAQVAEGWVGDETPPAQEYNDLWFQYSTWAKWVAEGKNTAALDDHIVETDAAGIAKIAQLQLGGTAFAGSALTATSNASGAAGTFTDTVGNFAVTATANGASAAFRGTHTGTGFVLEMLATGTNNGAGKFTGTGTGPGVEANGGANGKGIEATGGATSGSAVDATSQSASPAIIATGGPNSGSEAVQGVAGHDDATAVTGQTTATASSSSEAVFGNALADGVGTKGKSVDGYGVVAESDATGPKRAALRVVPQDADPTTVLAGDVCHNSAEKQHKVYQNSRWQGLWATEKGYCRGFAESLGNISTTSATFQSALTCNLAAPYDPKLIGSVEIEVSFECGTSAASTTNFEWRILDVTHGANTPIAAQVETTFHTSASVGSERYVQMKTRYILPATGVRAFRLEYRSVDGLTVSRIRRMSIGVSGVY